MTPLAWAILALMLVEAVGIWWAFCRPVGRALREARAKHDHMERSLTSEVYTWMERFTERSKLALTLTAERDEARVERETWKEIHQATHAEGISLLEDKTRQCISLERERDTLTTEVHRLFDKLNQACAATSNATTSRDAAIARADDLAARLAGETVRAGEAEVECATWRDQAVTSAELVRSAVQEQERLARIVARRDQPRVQGGRFGRREASHA